MNDIDKTTAERMLNVARGCFDYRGGYHDSRELGIYHHGIQTVVNALGAFLDQKPGNLQVRMLEVYGAQMAEREKAKD